MLKGISCSLLQRIAVMDRHLSPKTNVMPVSHRQTELRFSKLVVFVVVVCMFVFLGIFRYF